MAMKIMASETPRPRSPPEDAVQHPPVVNTRNAPRLVRQRGLDHRPFEIRQIEARHLNPPLFENVEAFDRFGNPLYGSMT